MFIRVQYCAHFLNCHRSVDFIITIYVIESIEVQKVGSQKKTNHNECHSVGFNSREILEYGNGNDIPFLKKCHREKLQK